MCLFFVRACPTRVWIQLSDHVHCEETSLIERQAPTTTKAVNYPKVRWVGGRQKSQLVEQIILIVATKLEIQNFQNTHTPHTQEEETTTRVAVKV